MKRMLTIVVLTVLALLVSPACAKARKTLDIYFLDMMGGGSTLIVTPMGESILIDTGSLDPKHRDADRILAACKDAGLDQIDHLITTHFDSDHYGAIMEVSKRIAIKKFYDKGLPSQQHQQSRSFKQLYPLYEQVTSGKSTIVKAGDHMLLKTDPDLKFPDATLHCVASNKVVEGFSGDIDAAVDGFEMAGADDSDNARSIAMLLSYGDFQCFLGGDITLNVEHHLAQPKNRIGRVDLYQITHHGLDQSNNPTLLEALTPTVAVAMNGRQKGIQPRTFEALNALASIEAVYTNHYNTQYEDAGNQPVEHIANAENPEGGNCIKASVNHKKKNFTIEIFPKGKKQKYNTK